MKTPGSGLFLCMCALPLLAGCPPSGGGGAAPLRVGRILGTSSHLPIAPDALSEARRRQELTASRQAGVHWIRRDFNWRDVEPVPGAFDFSGYDTVVDQARAYGFEIIGLLGGPPPWAVPAGGDSALDLEAFARYVTETVGHFRGRVDRWEVWNEENNPTFWTPAPDPGAYARLLETAAEAVRSVDPRSRVALGGLASIGPDPWRFLRDLYAGTPTLGRFFNALALHPYTLLQRAAPDASTIEGSVSSQIESARADLAAHGDGDKPIWVTELGWPACTAPGPDCPPGGLIPNVSPTDEASFLLRAAVLALEEGVEVFCWYTFSDSVGGSPSSENAFGLYTYSADPTAAPPNAKPSYLAYRTLGRWLGDAVYAGSLPMPQGAYGALFRTPGGTLSARVFWTASGTPSFTTQVEGDRALLVDRQGHESLLRPGATTLTLSPSPVLVVERAASWNPTVFQALGVVPSLQPGEERVQETAADASLGLDTLRIGFDWARMEPTPGTFDFSPWDDTLGFLGTTPLTPLGLLGFGNPLYSSVAGASEMNPPDDPAAFARYAAATVGRYASQVRDWEVWNEENAGYRFWLPQEDPAAYGRLLAAASSAIKGVDAGLRVVLGGLFYAPQGIMGAADFLDRLYAAHPGIGASYDALGLHPYMNYPPQAPPEVDAPGGLTPQESIPTMIRKVRQVLAAHGDAKPIWVTEVGWPVWGKVSEETQAEYLVRSALLLLAQGVERVVFFNGRDGPNFTQFPPEEAFGLYRYGTSPTADPKPAAVALGVFARALGPCSFLRDSSPSGRDYLYEFQCPADRRMALWSLDPAHVVSVGSTPLEVIGCYGDERPPSPVTASPEPSYIILQEN